MLVWAYDRRVNQNVLDFRLTCQCMHNSLPYTLASPTREANVHRMPSTELSRQVAPWTASTGNPQHRLEKPAIVGCRSAPVAFFARQDAPYFVPQLHRSVAFVSSCLAVQKTGCKHKFSNVNSAPPAAGSLPQGRCHVILHEVLSRKLPSSVLHQGAAMASC